MKKIVLGCFILAVAIPLGFAIGFALNFLPIWLCAWAICTAFALTPLTWGQIGAIAAVSTVICMALSGVGRSTK